MGSKDPLDRVDIVMPTGADRVYPRKERQTVWRLFRQYRNFDSDDPLLSDPVVYSPEKPNLVSKIRWLFGGFEYEFNVQSSYLRWKELLPEVEFWNTMQLQNATTRWATCRSTLTISARKEPSSKITLFRDRTDDTYNYETEQDPDQVQPVEALPQA